MVTPEETLPVTSGRWFAHHFLGVHLDRGRIRFGNLSAAERWMVVSGIVAIGGLLVLLVHPAFVPAHLFTLFTGPDREQIPRAVPPILLVALGVFSILLLNGALRCPPLTRALGAVGFVLVNAQIAARFTHGPVGFGRIFVGIGFAVAVIAILASAVLDDPRTTKQIARPELILNWLRRITLAGAALFYLSLVILCLVDLHSNPAQQRYVGDSIERTVESLYDLLGALFVISALAVVRFAYGLSQITAEAARALAPLAAKVGAAALLVAGVVFTARRFNGSVLHDFGLSPTIDVLVPIGGLLLVAFTWRVRKAFAAPATGEVGIERLMFTMTAIYAIPLAVFQIGVSGAYLEEFVLPGKRPGKFSGPNLFGWIVSLPQHEWFQFVPGAVIFGLLFLRGTWGVARGHREPSREWFAALAMVSLWALWVTIVTWLTDSYSDSLLIGEIAFMVAIGTGWYLVRNFRTIDRSRLGVVAGIAALTWLVATGGNFVTILGRDLGLGPELAVAFGTALVLIGNSEFTGGNSRHFPRAARPLVWVSYLGFAVLVAFWADSAVGFSTLKNEYLYDTTNSYLLFAIPLAAWLALKGRFAPNVERRERASLSGGVA